MFALSCCVRFVRSRFGSLAIVCENREQYHLGVETIAMETLFRAENRILRCANAMRSRLSSPQATKHLKDGFMHRLLMSQDARRELEQLLTQQGQRIPEPAELARLSNFLNGFYLNLVGALDNLAWILTYELKLREEIDEEGKTRTFVGLYKPRFREALNGKLPELGLRLANYQPWFDEVKSLRDPAAHRMPLGFVSGYVAGEDVDEFNRLMLEAQQSFQLAKKETDHSVVETDEESERLDGLIIKGFGLRGQAEQLAQFSPVIVRFGVDNYKFTLARSLLRSDQVSFLRVSATVLEHLDRRVSGRDQELVPD